jgi:hypothetical protein
VLVAVVVARVHAFLIAGAVLGGERSWQAPRRVVEVRRVARGTDEAFDRVLAEGSGRALARVVVEADVADAVVDVAESVEQFEAKVA